VRGLIDRRSLANVLGLRPTQRIALAQTIGYPAPQSITRTELATV